MEPVNAIYSRVVLKPGAMHPVTTVAFKALTWIWLPGG